MEIVTRLVVLLLSTKCYFTLTASAQSFEQGRTDSSNCQITVDKLNSVLERVTGELTKTRRSMSKLRKQLEKYEDARGLKQVDVGFDVTVAMINSDTIDLQLSRKDRYKITDFYISYTKGDGAEIHRQQVTAGPGPETNIRLSSLESGTEYLIYIQAYDRSTLTVQGGPYTLRLSTAKEVPTVVKVEVKNITSSAISLGFQLTTRSAAVTYFDIRYSRDRGKMVSAGTVPIGHDFEITSLESDTGYTIVVTAYNRNELGFIGNPVTLDVETAYIEPSLTVLSLDCCSVYIGLEIDARMNVSTYNVAVTRFTRRYLYSVTAVNSTGQAIIQSLMPNTSYVVRVNGFRDYNPHLVGRPASLNITTNPRGPDIEIMPLVIQSSEAVFYVDAAPILSVDSFSIKFFRAGYTESFTLDVPAENSRADFRLTNLQANTEYSISVDAVAGGKIVASSNTTVTTPFQFPDDVPKVTVGSITDEYMELNVTTQPNLNVSYFRITSRALQNVLLYHAKPGKCVRLGFPSSTDGCFKIQAMQDDDTAVGNLYLLCGRTKLEKNVFL